MTPLAEALDRASTDQRLKAAKAVGVPVGRLDRYADPRVAQRLAPWAARTLAQAFGLSVEEVRPT